jgi:hypothetical protein
MTRNGKIARLPKHVRQLLNSRLEDGEPGKQLVEWLNGLPEVQEVLKLRFGGRPISEQNLSEWKQGGYQEWLKLQESRYLVQHLSEQAEDLDSDAGSLAVSDRCATLLAVELARHAETLLQQNSDPRERWRNLQELLRAVSQLRRGDHQAARLRLDQERWNRQVRRLDQPEFDRKIKELQRTAAAPLWEALRAGSLAQIFGPGEQGRQLASMVNNLNLDLAQGTRPSRNQAPPQSAAPIQPNQSESNPIKPDQTPPLARQAFPQAQPDQQGLNLNLAPRTPPNRNQAPPQSAAPSQPNQSESNPIKPDQTPPPAREAFPQTQPNHHPTDPRPGGGFFPSQAHGDQRPNHRMG